MGLDFFFMGLPFGPLGTSFDLLTPPAAKALNALKNLGKTNATAKPIPGNDGFDSGEQIPSFDVLAPGGLAKEHTLGIRR